MITNGIFSVNILPVYSIVGEVFWKVGLTSMEWGQWILLPANYGSELSTGVRSRAPAAVDFSAFHGSSAASG